MFSNWDGQWVAFVSDDDSRWGPGRMFSDGAERLAYHGALSKLLENQMPQPRMISEQETYAFQRTLDASLDEWLRRSITTDGRSDMGSTTGSERTTGSEKGRRADRAIEQEQIADEKRRGVRIDFVEQAWKRHLEKMNIAKLLKKDAKDLNALMHDKVWYGMKASDGRGNKLRGVVPSGDDAVTGPDTATSAKPGHDQHIKEGLNAVANDQGGENQTSAANREDGAPAAHHRANVHIVTNDAALTQQRASDRRQAKKEEKQRAARQEAKNRALLSEKKAQRSAHKAYMEEKKHADKRDEVVNPIADIAEYEREILKRNVQYWQKAFEYRQKYPKVFDRMRKNLRQYFIDKARNVVFAKKKEKPQDNTEFSNLILSRAKEALSGGPQPEGGKKHKPKLSMRAAGMIIQDQMADKRTAEERKRDKEHEMLLMMRMQELQITCETHHVPFLQDESGPRRTPPGYPGAKTHFPGVDAGTNIFGERWRDNLMSAMMPDDVLERKTADELTLKEINQKLRIQHHQLKELRLPLIRNIMSGVLPESFQDDAEYTAWRPNDEVEYTPDFPSSITRLTLAPLRRAFDIGLSTTARRDA
ncbi:unnamed protein product [Amoebophrya sp. A120]|nr:unnamed protein product [Amoebophrya sp. A120]|eukprot:GSA120T00023383001.1